MRRLAFLALALIALFGVAGCSGEVDNSYKDSPLHNGYPGPAPRDRN